MMIKKAMLAETKSINRDERIVTHVLHAKVVDRDSEVVLPSGGVFPQYYPDAGVGTRFVPPDPAHSLKVLLNHRNGDLPIARNLEIQRSDDVNIGVEQFAGMKEMHPLAETAFRLTAGGFMTAWSHGFIPLATSDDPKDMLPGQRGRTYTSWEELEISLVTVPSLREALNIAGAKSMVTDAEVDALLESAKTGKGESREEAGALIKATEIQSVICSKKRFATVADARKWVTDHGFREDKIDETETSYRFRQFDPGRCQENSFANITLTDGVSAVICTPKESAAGLACYMMVMEAGGAFAVEIPKECEALITRGPVRFEATDRGPEDRAWDAAAAVARLRIWAGGPDPEKIDWAKYRRGFTWFDAGNAGIYGAYKLPHHDILDGTLCVIFRGAVAAMGALLGARGGVDVPDADRKGMYTHLASHYKQYDREAPEFRQHDEHEWKALESMWKVGAEVSTANLKALDDMCTTIEQSGGKLSEVAKALRDFIESKRRENRGVLDEADHRRRLEEIRVEISECQKEVAKR